MNCEFCSSPVHVWFQCPKKPDGWKPARLTKPSTAALKEVQRGLAAIAVRDNSTARVGGSLQGRHLNREDHNPQAGTQALPVDTNGESPNGRAADFDSGSVGSTPASPSKFNKNEYQKSYMREVYRPRLKAKKQAGTLG